MWGTGQEAGAPTAGELLGLAAALAEPSPAADDAARVDRIAAMERVKSALCAAQARETIALAESRRSKVDGVRAKEKAGRIGGEIALARRESRNHGDRLLGLARVLVDEMPHTLAALARGDLSEWRATILARESACLSREQRALVDAELAGSERIATMSDAEIGGEARKIAYRVDPYAFVNRHAAAKKDRRVTGRPAPDGMMYLSAFLPMVQGVGVVATLTRDADAARATGDDRTRGQVMADTLVERVTGQASAPQTPVEIQLVMTDRALLGESDEPVALSENGWLPAPEAREMLHDLLGDTQTWIRRLVLDPESGRLAVMESSRREFAGTLRKQIIARDQRCRTPWCGAPIRHLDHVQESASGGATSETNGQGLREACNYSKQEPGWQTRSSPGVGAGDEVVITTPTGHTYTSAPPPLPGAPPTPKPERAA